MTRKERKNLATKIAKAEKRKMEASTSDEISKIEKEILTLCGKVQSIEDMVEIDDLVQEILET